MEKSSLRSRIERLGWRTLDENLWQHIEDFYQGVVILAPPLDTVPSPSGNAIYVLVEEIASRLTVPVLLLARWPNTGKPSDSRISDRILYDTKPMQPNWFESHLPYRFKRYLTGSGAPYSLVYARRAAAICRLINAKTIVVEDMPVFTSNMRSRNPRARIFLHQHNNALLSIPMHYRGRILSSLDGIIFVSHAARVLMETQNGTLKNISQHTIYNGVDLSLYDPARWRSKGDNIRQTLGISPHERVLMYAGRIAPEKGVAEAAEAFNLARMDHSHFLIIGDLDGSLFSSVKYTLRLKAAAECSNGKIHLLGVKSQSEMPAYYSAANVVIVPSVGHEGLPKVITEALAMGKPCLVSRRGGMLELIREGANGWVIPDPQDIPDLAGRISSVLRQANTVQVDRSLVDAQRMAVEFQQAIGLGGT